MILQFQLPSRWPAAGVAGLDQLPCIVAPHATTPGQILALQMATVMHRAEITGAEKWQACERLLRLNPHWQRKDLAFNLSLSESMVVRLLAPGKCVPAWQEALKAGTVGVSDCYQASLMPAAEQASLLAFKLSGHGGKKVSRNTLAEAARKLRNGRGAAGAVKQSRVVCPLSAGTRIVVTGPEMSLDQYIETLQLALDVAKKAVRESLDIKVAQRVWAQRAKRRPAVGDDHA